MNAGTAQDRPRKKIFYCTDIQYNVPVLNRNRVRTLTLKKCQDLRAVLKAASKADKCQDLRAVLKAASKADENGHSQALTRFFWGVGQKVFWSWGRFLFPLPSPRKMMCSISGMWTLQSTLWQSRSRPSTTRSVSRMAARLHLANHHNNNTVVKLTARQCWRSRPVWRFRLQLHLPVNLKEEDVSGQGGSGSAKKVPHRLGSTTSSSPGTFKIYCQNNTKYRYI